MAMKMKMSRVFPILFVSVSLALAQFSSPSLTLRAPNSLRGDGFGFTLAAGDLNGGGASDLVASDFRDGVYVFYGEPSLDSKADVTASGPELSGFGSALATGDFNADGNVDLVVSAPEPEFDDEGTLISGGRVFVYFGGSKFKGLTNFIIGDPSPTDLGGFGSALAASDVNGDGAADLVIGSPGRDAVVVYFGGKKFGSSFLEIQGPERGASFGAAIASGDVNGDGIGDILVGAPDTAVGGIASAGAVFIYFGGKTISHQPNGTIRNPEPSSDSDLFGTTILVADVTGDQKPDVIASAPWATVNGQMGGGRVFIFPGSVISTSSATGVQDATNATALLQLNEPVTQTGSTFGWALASGDFNRDGVADLAIGAPGSAVGGRSEVGHVYIYFGGASLRTAAHINLRPPNPAQSGSFGVSILPTDVNKDSVLDLVIGAIGGAIEDTRGPGEVFVYLGEPQEQAATVAKNRTNTAVPFQASVASSYLKLLNRSPST